MEQKTLSKRFNFLSYPQFYFAFNNILWYWGSMIHKLFIFHIDLFTFILPEKKTKFIQIILKKL